MLNKQKEENHSTNNNKVSVKMMKIHYRKFINELNLLNIKNIDKNTLQYGVF